MILLESWTTLGTSFTLHVYFSMEESVMVIFGSTYFFSNAFLPGSVRLPNCIPLTSGESKENRKAEECVPQHLSFSSFFLFFLCFLTQLTFPFCIVCYEINRDAWRPVESAAKAISERYYSSALSPNLKTTNSYCSL